MRNWMRNLVQTTARPTRYKGVLFRSLLEARWAVFFDEMGIKYAYEPYCDEVPVYGIGYSLYKPDFFLPEHDLYAEVKPFYFRDIPRSELEKIYGWAKDEDVIVLCKEPRVVSAKDSSHVFVTSNNKKKRTVALPHFRISQCPDCGRIDFTADGCAPYECSANGCGLDMLVEEYEEKVYCGSKKIKAACRAARCFGC